MSGKFDNYDDMDLSVMKRRTFTIDVIETEKSYTETSVMDVSAVENDGKCKCGTSCTCTNCTCGH